MPAARSCSASAAAASPAPIFGADGEHDHLDRGQPGRHPEPGVVAVGHDERAHQP